MFILISPQEKNLLFRRDTEYVKTLKPHKYTFYQSIVRYGVFIWGDASKINDIFASSKEDRTDYFPET